MMVVSITRIAPRRICVLGRRVRIWHHGGMILHARAIGDDVHIRHNTTFGVARRGLNRAIPTIGDRVYIGCGACILGAVHVGDDSVIGANAVVAVGAVVLGDVAPYTIVGGVPAKVLRTIPHGGADGDEPAAGADGGDPEGRA